MPREKKLRSRWWPVGRAAATHRVQRRPDRPPPIRNDRRHPGTQMCQPRAGARRCARASPVRRDRMWSLPIIPAAAYILLINSPRRVNETVGTPAGVNSPPAQFGTSTAGSRRMRQLTTRFGLLVCTSLAIMVTSNGGAPAILSSNPLKDLPALRTPHLSWPFPEPGQCTRVWFSPDGFASNFGAIAPLLQGTWVTTAPRAATSPTAQWRSLTAFCTTSYESLAPAHLD
jgi:hypothetical protein